MTNAVGLDGKARIGRLVVGPGAYEDDSKRSTIFIVRLPQGRRSAVSKTFSIAGRIRSIRHAFRGIGTMLRSQHNAWIHGVATVLVVALGLTFRLTRVEWCCLILAMMAVWTAEALNTAFEFLADVASPDFHPLIKQAKDVAAGAVLISAIGSAVVGLLVLGPHVLTRVQGWL